MDIHHDVFMGNMFLWRGTEDLMGQGESVKFCLLGGFRHHPVETTLGYLS